MAWNYERGFFSSFYFFFFSPSKFDEGYSEKLVDFFPKKNTKQRQQKNNSIQ